MFQYCIIGRIRALFMRMQGFELKRVNLFNMEFDLEIKYYIDQLDYEDTATP